MRNRAWGLSASFRGIAKERLNWAFKYEFGTGSLFLFIYKPLHNCTLCAGSIAASLLSIRGASEVTLKNPLMAYVRES